MSDFQMDTALRAALADVFESNIGTSPLLRIYTGAKPADNSVAATGTKLCEITLPSDWLTNPGTGVKAMIGTWEQLSALATGTAGYFRIYDSTGTTSRAQGSVTLTGGGGTLTLDNVSIVTTQDVKVTSFQFTIGNA